MIYSCLHVDTTGPDGTSLRPRAVTDGELNYIGEQGGRHWYVGMASQDQQADIDLREEPMADVSNLIKQSQMASALKQGLRKRLTSEVGDLHDLIADQSKIIEFIYVMLARISADYLGGQPMSIDARASYLQRTQAVLHAIDSGQATLRGSFEDMDSVLQNMIHRQSRINELVRDEYVLKLQTAQDAV